MEIHFFDEAFKKLGRKNPAAKYLSVFKNPGERDHAIGFLNSKLKDYLGRETWYIDNKLEWNIIHSIRILGELRAEESIDNLIAILDMVEGLIDSYICDATAVALENLAEPAFGRVYEHYRAEIFDPDSLEIWLSILAASKRKDKRLRDALIEHLEEDPVYAIHLMAETKDQFFIPHARQFVEEAAASINRQGINPFEIGARFESEDVDDYINTREELVVLESDHEPGSEEFDKAVEELDARLIKKIDPAVTRRNWELINQIKSLENPGGAGYYYRISEMTLRQTLVSREEQVHLGRIVAILLAAHTHPEILSPSIIFPKILSFFKLNGKDESLVRQFNYAIMELWNHLIEYQSPEEFAFLELDETILMEEYIKERCAEFRDYLGILLYNGKLDKLKYSIDSQHTIEYLQAMLGDWQGLIEKRGSDFTLSDFRRLQVLPIWGIMNALKSLEVVRREMLLTEGSNTPASAAAKPGRNEPCPCGSGKKYKHCCMN